MRKYVIFGLLSILILAVLLRLLPLITYEFWGVDTGEYYGIANSLYVYGHIDPSNYYGFGFTYPYFPSVFMVISSASLVTTLNLYFTFSVLMPIIGAVSAILVYLISHSIFRNEKASLLASLFVAVVVVNVYQTSRTMPANLGNFLLLLCLLLLVKAYDDKRFYVLLAPATVAIVMTHHLSTYFLLACCFGMVFFREIVRHKNDSTTKSGFAYLVFLITVITVYWFGYVTPFITYVVAPAFPLPTYVLPVLLYGAVALLYVLKLLRDRSAWRYPLKYRGSAWNISVLAIAIAFGIAGLFFITFFGVSGIQVEDKTAMLMFIPVVILVAFAGIGILYADFNRHGTLIFGWSVAIGLSFVAAVILNSHEILPDRHAEIMMAIVGLLIGYGIIKAVQLLGSTRSFKTQAVAVALVFSMFTVMAFTAYPSTSVFGGGEQGSYIKDIEGVTWAKSNIVLPNNGVIASENRLSSDLYGIATLNATWYSAHDTFYATNFNDAKKEMSNCSVPSGTKRIDYIFLDKAMINNAILVPWEPHQSISGPALDKFDNGPYIKIFDNGYCSMYVVDWNSN